MSNYLYFQHRQVSLNHRYDVAETFNDVYVVNGFKDWFELTSLLLRFLNEGEWTNGEDEPEVRRRILNELGELSGNRLFQDEENIAGTGRPTAILILTLLLLRLKTFYQPIPANQCPRLFISHRRSDLPFALRIAEIAHKQGFAYWLDALDPELPVLANSHVSEKIKSLLTACIIEMALINSTHVIACMTADTRGSLWLPYEYGRITDLPGASKKASAWIHPGFNSDDLPEYMLLGELAFKEKDIERWLFAERQLCGKKYCVPVKDDLSAFNRVDRLPEAEKKKDTIVSMLKENLALQNDLHFKPLRLWFKKK